MKKNNNIIIFGTGLFYSRRKQMLSAQTKIVAFIDNDVLLQGTTLDDVLIYSPQNIGILNYDVIVLASSMYGEMKKQLLSLGVPEKKIMYWEEYISSQSHGMLQQFNVDTCCNDDYKKYLIIVPIINFAGGFFAALYVAVLIKKCGFSVTIASPCADEKAVLEANKQGINVWLCPALPYIEEEELCWIKKFDFVWANSLQTMICVDRISKVKPVVWWLHEHSKQYEEIIEQYGKEIEDTSFPETDIYAVSNIAKRNFVEKFPATRVNLLALGVPDFYKEEKSITPKINIAVIGTIFELKNQKEIVKAIERLSVTDQNKIECWFIGKDGRKRYKEELKETIEGKENIKILGELDRETLQNLFPDIDIVVCCSLEETFSIVIAEGLMNKKICITNTNTGIADFITDGVNGYIYSERNEDELTKKLAYVIQNFKKLDYVRNNARKTYEENLSMQKFEDRVKRVIEKEENN